MAEKISYKIDVNIAGELKKAVERSITVEAYAKIEVEVPKKENGNGNAGKATLRSLPGAGNEIGFLLITSTVYNKKLKVNKKSDGSEVAVLSEPIALFSSEAVGQLDIPDAQLELENETDQHATVQVIVGWDAVA